jgi:lactoylglutathione lyase
MPHATAAGTAGGEAPTRAAGAQATGDEPSRRADGWLAAFEDPLSGRPITALSGVESQDVDAVPGMEDDDRRMAQLVGINHVALEVGDLEEALDWYGRFFDFELRGRVGGRMAFIDLGDQFIALASGRTQPADGERHFGLVVDDKEAVRGAMQQAGVGVQDSGSLDFHDPWGNHIQVVDYREIQFTKATGVLRGMRLDDLKKSESAQQELRDKGLAD